MFAKYCENSTIAILQTITMSAATNVYTCCDRYPGPVSSGGPRVYDDQLHQCVAGQDPEGRRVGNVAATRRISSGEFTNHL